MRLRYILSVILGLLWVAPASAATHYLTVINDGTTDLIRVETAEPETNGWISVIEQTIPGGRQGEATVAMAPPACVWDIRLSAADRPALIIRAWNVCRQPVLHVAKAYQRAVLNRGAGQP